MVNQHEREMQKVEESARNIKEDQIEAEDQKSRELKLRDTNIPIVNTCISPPTSDKVRDFYRTRFANKIVNDLSSVPPIVFDFRYIREANNKPLFLKAIRDQMLNVIEANLRATNPFNLTFFEYDRNSTFHRTFATKDNEYGQAFANNLIFDNAKSYKGTFPRERLMYLTDDAKSTMHVYDPNKIYIIGSVLDDGKQTYKYASYTQSKCDGIRSQRLPLDKYFK